MIVKVVYCQWKGPVKTQWGLISKGDKKNFSTGFPSRLQFYFLSSIFLYPYSCHLFIWPLFHFTSFSKRVFSYLWCNVHLQASHGTFVNVPVIVCQECPSTRIIGT